MSVSQPHQPTTRRRLGALSLIATSALLASLAVVAQPASAAPPCPVNGIPFTSELTNGQVKIGKLDPATGATASVCGVVAFTPQSTLEATIPQANITFGPLEVPLAIFDVPVTLTAASDFTGPVAFAGDGIHIRLTGQVVATTKVLGSTCTIGPFTTTLTTDTSGSLTGTPFSGPTPSSLTGQLVGNEDPVPGAKLSLHCLIAPILNGIIGLPAAPGQSMTAFDASLVLSPASVARLNAARAE